jgi:pimeloyl-ACP methyl ester carboxylesterase
MRGIVHHKEYEIEYFVYGNGPEIAFAFHGFNNHATDYKALGDTLRDQYTLVSINIFFHGSSTAKVGVIEKGFSVNDLKDLARDLSGLFPSEKYTLIGYSLGGRIVLKLLEIVPEKIERVILLSPDGIRSSRFYLFLTQTIIGKNVFTDVIKNPSSFHQLAGFLRKSKIISEKRYQFAISNFDSDQKRKKVYQVWMTLRKISSKNKKIKSILKEYKIPLHLFFGRHDKIIPPSIGINYRKGYEKLISMEILETGHRLLTDKTLKEIGVKIRKIKNDAG